MYSPASGLALQTAKCLIESLLRSLFRGVIDTAKSKWYNMTINEHSEMRKASIGSISGNAGNKAGSMDV